MDRYQRVEKPRPEEPINENEIRITAQGLIRNYISYATTLLQVSKLPYFFFNHTCSFLNFLGLFFWQKMFTCFLIWGFFVFVGGMCLFGKYLLKIFIKIESWDALIKDLWR